MKIQRALAQTLELLGIIKKISLRKVYLILKKASEDLPKVVVKQSAHGIFCGFENDYLYQSALTHGSNETHFEELVTNLLSENSNVLDVGANIGTHSIMLSKIVKNGMVFSFEPQSLVFSILQNNLLLNHCKNVISYRFAISNIDDKTISMEPFLYSGKRINNGMLKVDGSSSALGDLVLTKRLDSFDFPKIDFIKLDIQGSEIAALIGAASIINRDRPIMFIEIEERYLNSFGGSSKELIERILGLDYILYRIETHYPCDHLCIPVEKVENFEMKILGNIPFTLTKIEGKRVELTFDSRSPQNYKTLTVIE